MKPNRDPLAQFCDLDDPDEVRQVEVLREMSAMADEIVATAKQNAECLISSAEQQAKRLRDRVQLQAREISRRQRRAGIQADLSTMYHVGAGGE